MTKKTRQTKDSALSFVSLSPVSTLTAVSKSGGTTRSRLGGRGRGRGAVGRIRRRRRSFFA
jgi:hypothetical protein